MDRVSFTLEFLFKASPTIVYKFLTAPDCIIRWFCDEVDVQDDVYTYSWDGEEEVATLIDDIEEERLKFEWEEGEDEEFLEFNLSRSGITGETILTITDFCDDDEVSDQEQLWTSQMAAMKKAMGG